jgi:hypothetical protein
MLARQDYMDELLAQRAQFIDTFYAVKANADESRTRLIACARLLVKKEHPFFFCADFKAALDVLLLDTQMTKAQQLLMLQLYAVIHQNPQEIVDLVYKSSSVELQNSAPLLALLMGVDDDLLLVNHPETVVNNHLISAFYRHKWSLLSEFSVLYFPTATPLTQLYLKVLVDNKSLSKELITDFIHCDYLHSHLFELYIVRLDERQVTAIVNYLSSDEDNASLIIKVMALSGYSKFIPFLARYLQRKEHTLAAHHALRILLGESLDNFMPDAIQFAAEKMQRIQDFTYYGAKILHYWDSTLLPSVAARILSGQAITPENLATIWLDGSQAHRRVAALHQTQFSQDYSVIYYACPEAVL